MSVVFNGHWAPTFPFGLMIRKLKNLLRGVGWRFFVSNSVTKPTPIQKHLHYGSSSLSLSLNPFVRFTPVSPSPVVHRQLPLVPSRGVSTRLRRILTSCPPFVVHYRGWRETSFLPSGPERVRKPIPPLSPPPPLPRVLPVLRDLVFLPVWTRSYDSRVDSDSRVPWRGVVTSTSDSTRFQVLSLRQLCKSQRQYHVSGKTAPGEDCPKT